MSDIFVQYLDDGTTHFSNVPPESGPYITYEQYLKDQQNNAANIHEAQYDFECRMRKISEKNEKMARQAMKELINLGMSEESARWLTGVWSDKV